MITALDTDGRLGASLTQANTDSDVMTNFLRYLVHEIYREIPGYLESAHIFLDGAAWHTCAEMKERLARMWLPVIYSGPYSYSTAPIELVFAALKLGELNP